LAGGGGPQSTGPEFVSADHVKAGTHKLPMVPPNAAVAPIRSMNLRRDKASAGLSGNDITMSLLFREYSFERLQTIF
jgi:hypothetical protein